jgi:hypothetical protein
MSNAGKRIEDRVFDVLVQELGDQFWADASGDHDKHGTAVGAVMAVVTRLKVLQFDQDGTPFPKHATVRVGVALLDAVDAAAELALEMVGG